MLPTNVMSFMKKYTPIASYEDHSEQVRPKLQPDRPVTTGRAPAGRETAGAVATETYT
ncbi:hypothetical protein FOCC_FOCC014093, partial [Frankliniella occidentalis]